MCSETDREGLSCSSVSYMSPSGLFNSLPGSGLAQGEIGVYGGLQQSMSR